MTTAKPAHIQARNLLLQYLNIHPGTVDSDLDPAEVGIVGGPAHVKTGTSYHLGKDDLILARRPYSVYESPRDTNGLNQYASAMDVGQFRIKVGSNTYTLKHFSAWLIIACKNNEPETRDIREVIYSLDGSTVRRWDRLRRRVSGDESHLWHTHISEFRDADGSRMVLLVEKYLREIGLLGMPGFTAEQIESLLKYDPNKDNEGIKNPYPEQYPTNKTIAVRTALIDTTYNSWKARIGVETLLAKLDGIAQGIVNIAQSVDVGDTEIERIRQSLASEFDEDAIAQRILAGFSEKEMEDVSAALRAVLTPDQRHELSVLLAEDE